MSINELKTLLLEYIQSNVHDRLLPASLSESNLGLFLLKPDSSMNEVVELLKKAFKTEHSFVQEVKIPAYYLSSNDKLVKEYDFSLEGSVLIVETQSHFKLLLKGEDNDDEEATMDLETPKEKARILPFPEKTQSSVLGVVGLRNIGNTCFMNAALQCMSHTIELTNYFLRSEYKLDTNATNVMGTQGKLAESYASLIYEMWNGVKSMVSPNYFRFMMTKYNNSVSYR